MLGLESIHPRLLVRKPQLGLGRFGEAYVTSRARAYEGIDFEALRDRVVAVKAWGATHLDELAEQFTARATEAGARVFRTSDPEAVRRYVLEVARAHGVQRIVKSKSMATEEIHLNAFLQGEGNVFRGLFFVMTFFTIGVVSNFKKLWEEGIGKLAAIYALSLFGFIIWVGLLISWIFFHGVKPPLAG